MTRSKGTPPIHKPAFDEERVLRFAAGEPDQGVAAVEPADSAAAKGSGAERVAITLMLKPQIIARLRDEAGRKEKRIEQIVEKLVTKHLGKN